MIGPGAPIKVPKAIQPVEKHQPDYEVELTVVIGKAARDVSEADALDYVLAYTNANDVCQQQLFLSNANISYRSDVLPLPSTSSDTVGFLEEFRLVI